MTTTTSSTAEFQNDARAIASGDLVMVDRKVDGCVKVLWKQGGRFHMQSVGGTVESPAHTLDESCTSLERLTAHWAGFCGVTLPEAEPEQTIKGTVAELEAVVEAALAAVKAADAQYSDAAIKVWWHHSISEEAAQARRDLDAAAAAGRVARGWFAEARAALDAARAAGRRHNRSRSA